MPIDLTTEALIEELFRRSEQWKTELTGGVTRPLRMSPTSLGCSYGRGFMEVYILVVTREEGHYCLVAFTGIDDGNWNLEGPLESKEKAAKRASSAQTLCGPQALHWVPDRTVALQLCQQLGLSLNL